VAENKNPVWRSLYHFWSKIFAVNFGMGVVSGLVMAYQFGTNWSGFSEFAGSITGPLLTYEVLTAFFLEAGFLGVMLFGWNRVGPGLHFFATCMVALGTIISTFWILASNSWMQTPQGFEIVNGQVVPVDWFAVIFNPSFPTVCCICRWRPFSAARCSSAPRRPGICCAATTRPPFARCSRWRCG
jgi:cytochrome d ubiquinol oxidase subunit I